MPAKILLQLDTDPSPGTFDAVVAVDAGVDHLFRHGGVTPENVTPLVHGAMFTRGGDALKSTAIFVGGSDVSAAERLFEAVQKCFFGPVRVSVLLDASGCNTTAAAAVLSAGRHVELSKATVGVLGGTGPVGRRVAEMAALEGAAVLLGSRSLKRAEAAAGDIRTRLSGHAAEPTLEAAEAGTAEQCREMIGRCDVLIACGAAGVELVSEEAQAGAGDRLRVMIDLNAVPPAGIGGIGATDKGIEKGGRIVYGAIGVGGLKMKIHRSAVESLFEANDRVLDAAEVLEIGTSL